ncbi:mitogen-activated protein kinase kinase kinase 7-like [Drosophila sulfurigaster albostrigata]|uniref:mitogen-activated protein kinase kinase kinase 7-like n=1 Tax=Drosophila sulfurigaster albostrigata TaxID=89887 RepID=UPI002D21A743|nr:mitogen-activated protein kinase kinase kinase 7-like [Drosophila sulfurigaster albostrigata]
MFQNISQDTATFLELLTNMIRLYKPSLFYTQPRTKFCGGRFYLTEISVMPSLKKRITAIIRDRLHHPSLFCTQHRKGIRHLHSKKIIHRDLKPNNLLLFDNFKILKIADFGKVKQLSTVNTKMTGTFTYMAPEVCDPKGRGNYTEKCDIFSFGIIFWEVLSRKKPFYEFKDMHPFAIQHKILRGYRPNVNDFKIGTYLKMDIKELIKMCWHNDPKKRPNIVFIDNTLHNRPI